MIKPKLIRFATVVASAAALILAWPALPASVPVSQMDQDEMTPFLDQKDQYKADSARVQPEITDLERNLAAAPNQELHTQIEKDQHFIGSVRSIRRERLTATRRLI